MSRHAGPAVVIATYNVLADEYIRPEYYPRCSPDDVRADLRHPRLFTRVAELGADALCLQEVTTQMFMRFEEVLAPHGYHGHLAQKVGGKPDGCATFFREPMVYEGGRMLAFDDGGASMPSGHVAHIMRFTIRGRILYLVNTHLRWDQPGKLESERVGLVQARQLIRLLGGLAPVVICQDANAEPESAVMRAFREAGYADPHPASAATFISNGVPAKLDYVLHTADLAAEHVQPRPLTGETPLPSADEPSDHLPILARFFFS